MQKRFLVLLAALATLLGAQLVPVAAAYPSVTIDAAVTSQTYAFKVEPPVLIKVSFNNLQPAAGVDNLALSFRDNSTTPQEVFVLYVKTSGDLVLHVPIAGVTTDQLLGSWQSLGAITVRYWSDKLQVLDPSGNVLYEVTGSFPALGDVWAHSSNTTAAAFTSGTITVTAEADPAVLSKSTTEMINAMMPLIVTMVGVAVVVGFMAKLTDMVGRIFRF